MSDKIAGVCYVKAGATQFPIAGNVTVRPASVNREPVVSLSGKTYFKETPVSPAIEVECLTPDDFDITAAMAITDGTITAELANGTVATLTDAFHSGEPEINAAEGTVTLLYHGDRLKLS